MVWNASCRKKPSNCEAPAPNVNWLRLVSSTSRVRSTSLSTPGRFSIWMALSSSRGSKYPSWLSRRTLNRSASVLKTPRSNRLISRRMTSSWVVLLPTKVMRLTKYCSPSCTRIVTSTTGSPSIRSGAPSSSRRGTRSGNTVIS